MGYRAISLPGVTAPYPYPYPYSDSRA